MVRCFLIISYTHVSDAFISCLIPSFRIQYSKDRGDGKPGACALGDTIDERSPKDGYAAEAIVTGEACGRSYLATVAEKNSVGFLYDVSDITSPKLAQVFHLSPASETKNPIVAYDDRSLGEIDAESIIFFNKDDSPSGNPAILFAGAFSTTTSFWEFECGEEESAITTQTGSTSVPGEKETTTASTTAPKTLESSATAAVGSLATLAMASITIIAM